MNGRNHLFNVHLAGAKHQALSLIANIGRQQGTESTDRLAGSTCALTEMAVLKATRTIRAATLSVRRPVAKTPLQSQSDVIPCCRAVTAQPREPRLRLEMPRSAGLGARMSCRDMACLQST